MTDYVVDIKELTEVFTCRVMSLRFGLFFLNICIKIHYHHSVGCSYDAYLVEAFTADKSGQMVSLNDMCRRRTLDSKQLATKQEPEFLQQMANEMRMAAAAEQAASEAKTSNGMLLFHLY